MHLRTRLLITPLCLLLALGAVPQALADSAPSPEKIGKRLGDAVARIDAEPEEASKALKALVDETDLLDDYALYYLARSQRPVSATDAAITLDALLSRYPRSTVTLRAAVDRAEIYLSKDDAKGLAKLAETHAKNERRSQQTAAISLAAAKAFEKTDRKKAAAYAVRARRQGAATSISKEARMLIEQLRKLEPSLVPTSATALYAEAGLAGGDGDTKAQAELLDRFLAKYPDHAKATDAALVRAKIMSRAEGRIPAADWLIARAKKTTNKRNKARMLYSAGSHYWNGNDSAAAIRDFQAMLDLKTGLQSEQRARYALGRLNESARKYTAAAKFYRDASKGSDARVALEARWRSGWASYLAKNFEGAAFVFGKMAEEGFNPPRGAPSGREEGLYWQARSYEQAGQAEKAAETYALLLEELPDGFYAYLAEKRAGVVAKPPQVKLIEPGDAPLPADARRVFDRAAALAAAGLESYAAEEIAAGTEGLDADVMRRVLPKMLELGAYNTALRQALVLYRRGIVEEDELYPYLYPDAYGSIVQREATERDLDPYLVYSLMRQESLFDRFAKSPAAAYGLMQLLVPTANRMAKKVDMEPVDAADLLEPSVNIRLGTQYLADLAERFENDPVLMLAGYNAGERAADRWKTRLEGRDLDEYVEQISYRETRNYVKKILRNYRNYLRLYGQVSVEAPERRQSRQHPFR